MISLQTRIVFLLLCLLSLQAAGKEAERAPYTFAVFPYFSANEMEVIYRPVAVQLSSYLGQPVNFVTERSHKAFIHQLNNQQYDIALIPPFWYPVAVDRKGYRPLLKMAEPFRALILVPEDSPVTSIEELRGQTIATPPAFAPVSQLAIKTLVEHGLVPGSDVRLMANPTVDDCFRQVYQQQASACVSPPHAPTYYEKTRQLKFRSVLESRGGPGVALVVHQRLGSDVGERMEQFFLQLHRTEMGRYLLKNMKTRQFIAIEKGEYEPVRQLLKNTHPVH